MPYLLSKSIFEEDLNFEMLCGRTPPTQSFSSRERQFTFDVGHHQVISCALLSSTGYKSKQELTLSLQKWKWTSLSYGLHKKWTSLSSYRANPELHLVGPLRVTGALQHHAGDYKIAGVLSLGADLQHPTVGLLH